MHGIASAIYSILYAIVYVEISSEDMVTFTVLAKIYSTKIIVSAKQRYM